MGPSEGLIYRKPCLIPILLLQTQKQIIQYVLFEWFNPYMTNGLAHHYQLGESTFMFRGIRSDFEFLFHFPIKFL